MSQVLNFIQKKKKKNLIYKNIKTVLKLFSICHYYLFLATFQMFYEYILTLLIALSRQRKSIIKKKYYYIWKSFI